MLCQTGYRKLYRASAWYDLIVTWPFATPLTLGFTWAQMLSPLNLALGFPALPELNVYAVLFGNFFGSLVVVWSIARLVVDDLRLAVFDGVGRVFFSLWMIYALWLGASPIIWVFLIPELAWGAAQLVNAKAAMPSKTEGLT